MLAEVVELHPDRTRLLEEQVRRAVALSFPLFTYKEFKRLVRCEYHRLVDELRSTRSWAEISLHTGMTRAGLNKLGDEIPPKAHHSVIRTTLQLLQETGPRGLTLAQLAGAFYEANPNLDDGPSLKEAVQELVASGEVTIVEGRYVAAAVARVGNPGLSEPIEATVHRIAESVRDQDGEGDAQLDRISFRIPAGSAAEVLVAVREALVKVATETEEALQGEGQWLTVVLAGAPGLK